MGPERGSGREVITCRHLRFTFYFGILGYFTFGTTNLSLRYGSVLYWWSCKFKIARNCFPIIFPRLPSPKKESWLPYDGAGAGIRLMRYFTSLNHSLYLYIFGITAGFARFGWWNDGQAKKLMKNVTSIAYLFDVSDVNFHEKSFIERIWALCDVSTFTEGFSSDYISQALPVLTNDFNHELTRPEKCMSRLVFLGNFSIHRWAP